MSNKTHLTQNKGGVILLSLNDSKKTEVFYCRYDKSPRPCKFDII